MKVRIETIDKDEEEVIIIRCRELDQNIQKIQNYIKNEQRSMMNIVFFKQDEEFYFSLDKVLFFETDGEDVFAHTIDDAYRVKYRLYELEGELPSNFMRISKSAIINIKYIYSIQRNLTASSRIQFQNSYKEVYVSRMYYKALKFKLQERND